MKVYELIAKLQKMEQEAIVYRYDWSTLEEAWVPVNAIEQESVGWDDQTDTATYEVFIQ